MNSRCVTTVCKVEAGWYALFGFALLAFLYFVVWLWGLPSRREKQNARLASVERRVAQLFSEHPDHSDEQIAQFLQDELVNARAEDPWLYEVSSIQTVARVRRNLSRRRS